MSIDGLANLDGFCRILYGLGPEIEKRARQVKTQRPSCASTGPRVLDVPVDHEHCVGGWLVEREPGRRPLDPCQQASNMSSLLLPPLLVLQENTA